MKKKYCTYAANHVITKIILKRKYTIIIIVIIISIIITLSTESDSF